MGTRVRYIGPDEGAEWDAFVNSHPHANVCHLFGWKNIIEKTYGHKTYYLAALTDKTNPNDRLSAMSHELASECTAFAGVLPLVHLKHFLFGSSLISMPFLDLGGILAKEPEIEKLLLHETVTLGRKLNVERIELRQSEPLNSINVYPVEFKDHSTGASNPSNSSNPINSSNPKVRMPLKLPGSSRELMESFKSKLRSQIKKPVKEGLDVRSGGKELVEDFYKVFLVNMRDLGSPVHSKKLILSVLDEFENRARIFLVYKGKEPVASSLVIGFGKTLNNPWASSLKEYSRLSPNMLLYWGMLEYACDNGFEVFEFGRSTPGEGTYRFKEQWGATPAALHWHTISLKGPQHTEVQTEKDRFAGAVRYWQKLPVPVTRLIGPYIRKYIGL